MLASVLLSSGASYPPQSSEIWFVIGVGAPRFFLGVFLGPRLVHCLVLLRTRQQLIVLASVLLSSDATSPPQSPDTLVVMGVGAPRFFWAFSLALAPCIAWSCYRPGSKTRQQLIVLLSPGAPSPPTYGLSWGVGAPRIFWVFSLAFASCFAWLFNRQGFGLRPMCA